MNQSIHTTKKFSSQMHLEEEERMWIELAQNDNQGQDLETHTQLLA